MIPESLRQTFIRIVSQEEIAEERREEYISSFAGLCFSVTAGFIFNIGKKKMKERGKRFLLYRLNYRTNNDLTES